MSDPSFPVGALPQLAADARPLAGQVLVVEVVVPISRADVDQALTEVRAGVESDRATLAQMSSALDAGDAKTLRAARQSAILGAMIFGA